MKVTKKTHQPLDPLVEYAKYQTYSTIFDIGWWEMDLSEESFCCAASVANLLALDATTVSTAEFFLLIQEDYRQRIIDMLRHATHQEAQQYAFPASVEGEIVWISIRYKAVADQKVMGLLATASKSEVKQLQEEAQGLVKNFIYQLNGISDSLFSLLEKESFDQMVSSILYSFMTHFNAERSYIIEFDKKNMTSSCTYEVVSRPGLEEKDFLTNIPYEADDWWFQQIFSLQTIALSTLDDLPPGSEMYRELLGAQNIKSLLVVPLISSDKQTWGFAGIDLVDTQRNWSTKDIQWFSALMNIINICIELQKSKMDTETDRKYLQKLHEYMPIGYISERVIYNEANEPVDLVYVDFNQEMERIVGKPLDNIIGRKGSEMNTPGDFDLMLKVVNTDTPVEVDVPLLNLGKYCRVIRFSIHKDEVISLVMDITEVHEAHKAVEKNIYSNIPVSLELYDKDGYLIYVNDTCQKLLEIDNVSSVLGINIFEHPILSKDIMQKATKGEMVDFSFVYDLNEVGSYYRKTFPPHTMRDLTVKLIPIFDEAQADYNYLLMAVDNTETSNAYRRIQDFEEYFSTVANMAKIGYGRVNLTTGEGFGTAQWFVNLGKPADTKMTADFTERFNNLHPEDYLIIEDFYTKASKGIIVNIEREIRVMKDGDVDKWLKCTLTSKINTLNNEIELSAISEDITDFKDLTFAKNRAEELNRLKSDFMANMSHEIRTPLNSIIGFSDILADICEDEEQKGYLSIIQRNNELLLKLLSDILDLSKIESGTYSFDKREEHVCKILGDVMRSFNQSKIRPNVKIKLDPITNDYQIYTDADRVKQVLHNFMTNALKFTEYGSISLGCKQEDNHTLKFYVRDTGVGIPPEQHKAVFERFIKLDPFVQGTGLGLPICKALIKEMGGSIGVDSKPGKGACFWFTLRMK